MKKRDVLWVSSIMADADMNILESCLRGHGVGEKPPTYSEVRAAAVRLLRNDQDALGRGRRLVADLFDSEQEQKPLHRAILEKNGQGHPNYQRDLTIAYWISTAVASGERGAKARAVTKMAEKFDLDERSIERIYKNNKSKS